MGVRAALIALSLATAALAPVRIAITPNVLMPGASMRVTCSVPRNDANRWLTIGIAGYVASGGQLNGSEAAVTRQVIFAHVPCGSGPAFCELETNDSQHHVVQANFVVAGCEEP